jgi:hypothetical protein
LVRNVAPVDNGTTILPEVPAAPTWMCAAVGVLTPLSDVKVQQTLPVLVLRVTTAFAVPLGAPARVSAAPVIFTAYVRLRAFLTFATAELVVVPVEAGVLAVVVDGVLALVLLLELLLLPQPATPISATARLGMRSLERIGPSRLWTLGGSMPRTKAVSIVTLAAQRPG